ncbi:hypothetical protein ACFYVL_42680 [Streptomyces sp. NPDC004111]|uniref:hypothetical protein n=1 Tax=Streptomyces sp. NPDC004111 TaxID=3364690 RepID=UPI0036B20E4E
MDEEHLVIRLSADEAIVLLDWLERLQMTDLGDVVDDRAVWAPLHTIAAILDKQTPIPSENYPKNLSKARARLRRIKED